MPAGGVDRHRQRGRAHEVEALGHDGPPVHDRVLRRAGAGCPAPVGGAGHDVAGADVGDAVADGFDGAGHVDPDAPGPLVPVQAAAQRPVGRGEAARVDGHTDPAGPRPGDRHGLQAQHLLGFADGVEAQGAQGSRTPGRATSCWPRSPASSTPGAPRAIRAPTSPPTTSRPPCSASSPSPRGRANGPGGCWPSRWADRAREAGRDERPGGMSGREGREAGGGGTGMRAGRGLRRSAGPGPAVPPGPPASRPGPAPRTHRGGPRCAPACRSPRGASGPGPAAARNRRPS